MKNTLTFESTYPTNKSTFTQSLTLSETDQEKLSQYLTTILEEDNMARYVFKTETGEELDINPLRISKYIDVVHTIDNSQQEFRLSESQAEALINLIS